MATCGYLCPSCEGKGFKEDGTECDWCLDIKPKQEQETTIQKITIEEWIEKVHQGPCCSD